MGVIEAPRVKLIYGLTGHQGKPDLSANGSPILSQNPNSFIYGGRPKVGGELIGECVRYEREAETKEFVEEGPTWIRIFSLYLSIRCVSSDHHLKRVSVSVVSRRRSEPPNQN
jgi:hypothetical protein